MCFYVYTYLLRSDFVELYLPFWQLARQTVKSDNNSSAPVDYKIQTAYLKNVSDKANLPLYSHYF